MACRKCFLHEYTVVQNPAHRAERQPGFNLGMHSEKKKLLLSLKKKLLLSLNKYLYLYNPEWFWFKGLYPIMSLNTETKSRSLAWSIGYQVAVKITIFTLQNKYK